MVVIHVAEVVHHVIADVIHIVELVHQVAVVVHHVADVVHHVVEVVIHIADVVHDVVEMVIHVADVVHHVLGPSWRRTNGRILPPSGHLCERDHTIGCPHGWIHSISQIEVPTRNRGQYMKIALKQAALGLALVLGSGAALADEPVLTVLEPTGTAYLPGFPAVVPVAFRVDHADVSNLNVLKVEVDGASILGVDEVGNPFKGPGNVSACANIDANPRFSSCTLHSAAAVTVGLDWVVPAPGAYSLLVSVKHQGETGEDIEAVQFLTLTAEYPAPPAVANAYMNSTNPPKKAKVRGCVISAIAELHAKDSAYGPKGGPYDEAMIKEDTDAFRALCGG